jgi:hypothetical protein
MAQAYLWLKREDARKAWVTLQLSKADEGHEDNAMVVEDDSAEVVDIN